MLNKKLMIVAIFIVSLLTVSAVSAVENVTGDVVSVDENNELINQNSFVEVSNDNSDNCNEDYNILSSIEEDESYEEEFDTYENLYLSDVVDAEFDANYDDAYLTYYWDGYFEGKLVIYHGNSIVFSEIIKGNRDGAPTYKDCWTLEDNNGKPVPVGSYTAKLFSKGGKVLKTSLVKIRKAPTEFLVNSKTTNPGKKITIKDYVYGDWDYAEYAKGKITLKINGKSYSANVKNGKFSISFKAPSKPKKYSCKLIYSGDSNYKSSSTTFKLTVKKSTTAAKKKTTTKKTTTKKKSSSKYKIITTKAKSKWITKKSGKFKVKTKIWDMTAGSRAPYKYIDTTLYKNGKQVINTKYYVKYKINGKWTGWKKYGTTSTAHHRYAVKDGASVGQIKVKVNKNVNSFY